MANIYWGLMWALWTQKSGQERRHRGRRDSESERGLPALTGFEDGGGRPWIGACGNILQFTADKKTGSSAVAPQETEF